jgi:hypothetical protein
MDLGNKFRATSANGCFWQVLSVFEETKCLALTVVFDDDNCSRVPDVSVRNSLFVDKGEFKRIDSNFFELTTGDLLTWGRSVPASCIAKLSWCLIPFDTARTIPTKFGAVLSRCAA